MGKIVMPKNSAMLNEIESVLQIYYEAETWISNEEYKTKLKEMIGDNQYSSSYTKKAQITSYFGFTIWEDINNPQSRRRITESGRLMYEAIKADDTAQVQAVLMTALETVKFGRNNYGCPESNSDVEPPSLFIRAVLDLRYLTYREFAFMLWKLEDLGANYTDSLETLKGLRESNSIELGEEAVKYMDSKPIMILVRWGFLTEDNSSAAREKHIVIASEVLEKYKKRLQNLKIYNVDMNCCEDANNIVKNEDNTTIKENINVIKTEFTKLVYNTGIDIEKERNRIVFGAPGTGKSFRLKEDCKLYVESKDGGYERVTFHPDYTYSQFVGTYKPVTDSDGKIRYAFIPGPFMRVYVEALKSGRTSIPHPWLLLIEEINRAKVAAVFGDIFQLLDRDANGVSEYDIQATEEISKYLASELGGIPENYKRIRIPDNMYIWSTMNSADQGVFPMDTAFKRRWSFEYMGINTHDEEIHGHIMLGKTKTQDVEWNILRRAINEKLAREYKVNEDKLMGPFFLSEKNLKTISKDNDTIADADKFKNTFKSKVIMYLYEDAAKQHKHKLFSGCEDTTKYSAICKSFDDIGVCIFGDDFEQEYYNPQKG